MPKKKKKKTISDIITSTKFLKIVFILLLILVIILTIMCIYKSKKIKEEIHANIILPLTKEHDEIAFGINAKILAKKKLYVIKVTNYDDNTINSENKSYTITIENPTNSIIEVTKNDDDKDLMESKQTMTIENEELLSKEKEDIYYYIRIKSNEELTNKDMINVKVIN